MSMTTTIQTYREQLAQVTRELEFAYNRFENLADPDLIESEIYQIKCLQAKQAYLIKMAKGEAV